MRKVYNTKIIQVIMQYIEENKEESFDTQKVYDYLISQDINVNLATVYRDLGKLVKQNLLVKFKSSKSASSLYRVVDQKSNCHRHLHLQCRMCGRIYHLDGRVMEDLDRYIKNEFNFNMDCQNSVLTGICYECSSK